MVSNPFFGRGMLWMTRNERNCGKNELGFLPFSRFPPLAVEGLKGDDCRRYMNVQTSAFTGHWNNNCGVAQLQYFWINAVLLIAQDEARSGRILEFDIVSCVFGDLDGDQRVAVRLHLARCVFVSLRLSPLNSPVVAQAGDADHRVRRRRSASGKHHLCCATGVRYTKHATDVIGVGPILQQKRQFDCRRALLIQLSLKLARTRLRPNRFHERKVARIREGRL